MTAPDPVSDADAIRKYLVDLQDHICDALEEEDPSATFRRDELPGERGGIARPRVLNDGKVLERAAVNFSHAVGDALPPAATERKPELAGKPFQALSVSLIIHPRNPYAPTTHANFRAFLIGNDGAIDDWWFGGGFDLTPYYGFEEDAQHWHRTAHDASASFGEALYARHKQACDDYFFLPHRNEPRGIGGLFFDDFTEGGFDKAFAYWRNVGDAFLPAYLPILRRRKDTHYGKRERAFQTYRRGRYVEFNLLYDRGTRYGLQSRGRTESILASMPPVVRWNYDWTPEEGSEEARLYSDFLKPRDWL